MAPEKNSAIFCLPVQGLLNWKWPPTQNIYTRGGTGRRGTKITPVIFSHVGVFWILIVWVLKSHSSFKTLPFHLGAAHRLLLIYDLWTNTSFQMHWQEEQAVQVLFCCLLFLFLGAMYPPILTAYWRYISVVTEYLSKQPWHGMFSCASVHGRQHPSAPLRSPSKHHWGHWHLSNHGGNSFPTAFSPKGCKHELRWAREACSCTVFLVLFGEAPPKANAFKSTWGLGRS